MHKRQMQQHDVTFWTTGCLWFEGAAYWCRQCHNMCQPVFTRWYYIDAASPSMSIQLCEQCAMIQKQWCCRLVTRCRCTSPRTQTSGCPSPCRPLSLWWALVPALPHSGDSFNLPSVSRKSRHQLLRRCMRDLLQHGLASRLTTAYTKCSVK